MSNRRQPANQPDEPARWALLVCPDCASTVHEVWRGHEPYMVLSIEVEHSETCPAWRHEGRELGFAFGPDEATIRTALVDEDKTTEATDDETTEATT